MGRFGKDNPITLGELPSILEELGYSKFSNRDVPKLLASIDVNYFIDNPSLIFKSISGHFEEGESIIGNTTESTARILTIKNNKGLPITQTITFDKLNNKLFDKNEVIVGQSTGATAYLQDIIEFKEVEITLKDGSKFVISEIFGIENDKELTSMLGLKINSGSQRSGIDIVSDNIIFNKVSKEFQYYSITLGNGVLSTNNYIDNKMYLTFDKGTDIPTKGKILVFGRIIR